MSNDRRLSTSDLVDANRRAEAARDGDVVSAEVAEVRDLRDPDDRAPLFDQGDAEGYRTRWSAIQTGFVDEPRKAVEEADALVAEVVKRLAEVFSDERGRMESAWDRNETVSTEDLRQAMRRYRSFFERLLTV